MKILIVIPSYNENENISGLITRIFEEMEGKDIYLLIVDDSSPDGTAQTVIRLIEGKYGGRLFLKERPSKSGLASAYIEGFKWGIEKGYDAFIEMDADLSHDPKYLKEMIMHAGNNDCVIGSRYVKDGGVKGWGIVRKFISKGGSLYSRIILGIPVQDLTGGFNLWKKDVLENIGLDEIISNGYLFQIELKYRAYKKHSKIYEMPIIFEDRVHGKSKMSKNIFIEALIKIWRLKLIKFSKT